MGVCQGPGVILCPLTTLQGTGWAEGTLSLLRRVFFLVRRKHSKEEQSWHHHRLSIQIVSLSYTSYIVAVTVNFPIPLMFPVNCSYLSQ